MFFDKYLGIEYYSYPPIFGINEIKKFYDNLAEIVSQNKVTFVLHDHMTQ